MRLADTLERGVQKCFSVGKASINAFINFLPTF